MDYVKETLQKELRSVTREIAREDDHFKHVSEELALSEKRKDRLLNVKQQLITSLSAGTIKPFNDKGNACDICVGQLEVVETITLPGKVTALKDERCPCCG